MTDDEKKKAIRNIEKMLAPRDKNMNIVPTVSINGPPEVLYYPYFAPDENGLINPVFFFEDFVDGKTPKNVTYEPGYQREHHMVDDMNYMGSITYTDPRKNLSIHDQHLIRVAEQKQDRPPMKVSINRGDSAKEEFKAKVSTFLSSRMNDSDENTLKCDRIAIEITQDYEMLCLTAEDCFFLTNFSIDAIEHRVVLTADDTKDTIDEYQVRVKTKDKTADIVLSVKDIDNLVTIVQRKLPMCTVSSTVRRANAIVVNYVRNQLSALPVRIYVRISGFRRIEGKWVFAHDGADFANKNVIFQTGRTISMDPAILPRAAFKRAMGFLNISDKLTLTLPLLLVAHLSPMFNLFVEAGYTPRFVSFLNGRTGSMKTSVSLVVFRLFKEQPKSPEANFKDTEVALEIKLGEGHGKVVLVDDYRPPVTSIDGKSNLTKLESIIRAAGDRVSKSRSNSELGKAKEYLPSSCVVVTGEDLGGTQSSQLRMLVLPINKGDVDGRLLKQFQDDPLLISTHMYHFLHWVGIYGDNVIQFIQSQFEMERANFAQSLKEARVIDTAATLMLVARILHQYGCAVEAFAKGTETQIIHEWRSIISQIMIESEGITKVQNPVVMYLQAFFDMEERKEIEIARNRSVYDEKIHLGYYDDDGYIWIWHKEVFNKVRQYWQRVGALFPLSFEKINEHLDSAGLIRVSYEKREGGQKKNYTIKSSLPNRSRLVVLNNQLARQYLEKEGN